MTAAVGATIASSGYGSAGQAHASRGSRAGLEVQLDTYKKQLADWVDCPSGKTPEGKKKIEDLNNKVSVTKARIKDMDNTGSKSPTNNDLNANTSDARSVAPAAGPGNLIDTFA
jgi:hypothetical protein